MRVFIGLMLLFTVGCLAPSQLFADVVIIVNNKNSVDRIDKTEIKNIFLGNQSKWNNGDEIRVMLNANPRDNDEFSRKYLNKTGIQFINWWKKKLFTGRSLLPEKSSKQPEIINYIISNPGAISYIDRDAITEDVKIIQAN